MKPGPATSALAIACASCASASATGCASSRGVRLELLGERHDTVDLVVAVPRVLRRAHNRGRVGAERVADGLGRERVEEGLDAHARALLRKTGRARGARS